ncbi:magnesium-translocating P-type ATPase [Humibacter sp. BT305]|nr:magnesium-translocating P-type ATPase [Humibacter sp. BT305]
MSASSRQTTRQDQDAPALVTAATRDPSGVLAALSTSADGLDEAEAARRREQVGANIIDGGRTSPTRLLVRQLRNPILILLFATAAASAATGDVLDAAVIAAILALSTVLGFANEFRAARAADALRERVRYTASVMRDGSPTRVEVGALVPGDVVLLAAGAIVPADIRLLTASGLACDESVVTGEARPVEKTVTAQPGAAAVTDLACCVLMGTVVHAGTGKGVVVATGQGTEFGRIAAGLRSDAPQTAFQRGLAGFSMFLLVVAVILTVSIFLVALLLGRPLLQSLMFSLAIAVGITPQLLPAVVSTSLAAGTRALAQRGVLVKRLVCIEDLGDLDVLVTDKTGTLTTGGIAFSRAVPLDGGDPDEVILAGLLAADQGLVPGGAEAIDAALLAARPPTVTTELYTRLAELPFDHDRRMSSALVASPDGAARLIVKGAPESVFPRCLSQDGDVDLQLDRLYREGARVIAVAEKPMTARSNLAAEDESDLHLTGLLVFTDDVRPDAAGSVQRLAELGVRVKIATGDAPVVAERVAEQIGLDGGGTLIGSEIDTITDEELAERAREASVFARVSPEQKARIIRVLSQQGGGVGFLGDGVNDAVALHQADVGISVDTAVDVAKDAADVLLLRKDLGVLADGVVEGRRVFANTIKYVLMGTSSNFGNMVSASIASLILPFLPMLPGQILLNNLLYDAGQLTLPTDHADPEQLRKPAHWDMRAIRRFMLLFGPISSLFDFATFAIMLGLFQAAPNEFRSGWFIESIATQSLIVFAIRTRRVPFFTSRPSLILVGSVLAVVVIGVWLPYSPFADPLGFTPLPAPFFLTLVGTVLVYLVLVEGAKALYYRHLDPSGPPRPPISRTRLHRVRRRASGFTTHSVDDREGPSAHRVPQLGP